MLTLTKETIQSGEVYKFHLNDACRNAKAPVGTTICYYICRSESLGSFRVNGTQAPDTLEGLNAMLGESGYWETERTYDDGSSVVLNGTANSNVVFASVKGECDVADYLRGIEEDTYGSSNFSPLLISSMMSEFQIPREDAIRTLNNMNVHQDICAEFCNGVIAGCKYPDDEFAISEHGYTAHELSKQCGLSYLGAYHYLAFMRDKPDEALVAVSSTRKMEIADE